ncbi:MAG: PP2C family serine/threonine-protein phosphatase [Candidatus Moranbacteria bacterium]|jgi:hypothetical protein|nr:PP2C family serine/threonine-protein phosphatase [Candidatus Moranbacteria bacterium]
MLGTETQNKKKMLDTELFEIFVCKDQGKKPFLNLFQSFGNNFQEKKLGKIFGIIQTLDFSENSEYLPNLLAQIIKKEFYRFPKEGAEQCLENALHKANLALSDLAQNEIIQWIGKLDAVICVISGNELFISKAGNGRAFLVREKKFIEIIQSETAEKSPPHPIKTFSEIILGKINTNDKIIVTTNDVFRFLRKDELKRHSQVFNSKEFDNLIRSSLELEADSAGMILVNASEKTIYEYTENKKDGEASEKDINFFGSHQPSLEEIDKPDRDNKNVPKESQQTAPPKEPAETEPPERTDNLSELFIKEEVSQKGHPGLKGYFNSTRTFLFALRKRIIPTEKTNRLTPRRLFDKVKNPVALAFQKTLVFLKKINFSPAKQIVRNYIKKFSHLLKKFTYIAKIKLVEISKNISRWQKKHAQDKERKNKIDKI